MPFSPIWSRGLGGRVKNPSPSGRLGSVPQHNPSTDPRAASPAKSTSFVTSSKVITTESMTLGSSVQQGQTYPLPTLGDVTGLAFTLVETSVTGSGTVTLDYANIVDHIVIRNRNGTPFNSIPIKDPTAAGLNPAIYDIDTLFIKPTPTTVRKNQIAASTAISGTLATITVPGLRLSAQDGPWECEFWYNTVAGFGGTGVTALGITNTFKAMFGDAGGYNTKMAYQTIPTTGTGDYHLETSGIVKDTLINHLLLQNVSTLSNLDHMVINSRGSNIDTNLSEGMIVQAMTDNYYNAFGTKTLVPTAGPPGINTQFTIGSADELITNWGTSTSNVQFLYAYLLPAGDGY